MGHFSPSTSKEEITFQDAPSEQIERIYYQPKEAAKALAVRQTALVYYSDKFGLRLHRGHRGDRMYTIRDIGQIAIILRLVKHLNPKAAKAVYKRGDADRVLEILEPQIAEPVGYLMRMG